MGTTLTFSTKEGMMIYLIWYFSVILNISEYKMSLKHHIRKQGSYQTWLGSYQKHLEDNLRMLSLAKKANLSIKKKSYNRLKHIEYVKFMSLLW